MSSYTELLTPLYGPDRAARTGQSIKAALAAHAARFQREAKQPLDEKDVVLITYGGTFLRDGEAPLATLASVYGRYFRDLASAIHILPFYPYTSDDGFSVVDYSQVNPALGDWGDIARLAGQADLMFDGVINHISQESEWFQGFLADDPRYDGWFMEVPADTDVSAVVRPRPQSPIQPYQDEKGRTRHVWATFSQDQVDLNYGEPAVLLAVLDVLLDYVARGARFLRLDAIAFLWKRLGTGCIHLDETHRIIKTLRLALTEAHPDVRLITETNVPHRENISYFGSGDDEAHMVYNFALPPLVAHALISGNADILADWASGLSLPGPDTCFFNFTASHDGVGVRPVEGILTTDQRQLLIDAAHRAGGHVSMRATGDGGAAPYELNCTYPDLLTPPEAPDDVRLARMLVSQAIMLAMPGVPALYVHSCIGTRNDLDRVEARGHWRAINRSQIDADALEVALADGRNFRTKVHSGLGRLVAARRGHPAFHPQAGFTIALPDPRLFTIIRQADGGSPVRCIANVSASSVAMELPRGGHDLLSGERFKAGPYDVPPHGLLWLEEGA
ncbi:sugar phosphorylase [Yunchengibacter salinarum]|uniref:sugar phosphorylase n=1 Tax=Yunchengibacter salinarum TaxID=3133399 RepID=UPI0035B63ECF